MEVDVSDWGCAGVMGYGFERTSKLSKTWKLIGNELHEMKMLTGQWEWQNTTP